MNANDLFEYSKNCFRDDQPPCSAACPLRVDVPKMLDKIGKNRLSSAFREYRNAVLFPGIVTAICPGYCQTVCVRTRKDRPLAVAALERYLTAACTSLKPERFNVLEKPGHIAVVGGGLSGLGCALRLAQRNYRVTVYEKAARLGGALGETLAEEQYLPELLAAFEKLPCTFVMEQEIMDITQLEADAVYIATGRNGADFGLREGLDPQSLGTVRAGVFLGGECIGADPIHALEHGTRVSHSIEKYLKVRLMDGMPETYAVPAVNPYVYEIAVPDSPEPLGTEGSSEWAAAEAKRCGGCKCSLCYDGCELMRTYNRTPRRIVMDATSSLQPVKQLTSRINSRLIYSCNQCGLCKESCPEHVDTGGAILETRRQFHRDAAIPPAFYDYWQRDMDHALGKNSYLLLPAEGGETRYLFFPGCQLSASAPAVTFRTYRHLKTQLGAVGVWLGCCGIPAQWAGDQDRFAAVWKQLRTDWESLGRPELLFACTSCQKTFAQMLPEAQHSSVYTVLAMGAAPVKQAAGAVALFDPCAGRYAPAAGLGVRKLLERCGMEVHELGHHGQNAQCCGFGGHIYAANRNLAEAIAEKRTSESALPYIVYCANCRDVFAASGKDCRHVLDVLFGENDGLCPPPHLGQRRQNREALKCRLLGVDVPPDAESPVQISEELLRKMDRLLLTREEVERVLLEREADGRKLLDAESGCYITHGQAGILVCWVVYRELKPGCFQVENLYAHRFQIKNSG